MIITASNGHVHLTADDGDTKQLRRILSKHLPKVLDLFARKNRQYGENPFELGAAGQFPEVWRKVQRLRTLLWERPRGGFTEFEDAEEVIGDLIGHLLMLLDCLDDTRSGRYHGPIPPMVDDVVGHQIRESKGGPETWVDPGIGENNWSRSQRATARTASHTETDDDGVKRYPPGFRGRHSFLVGSVARQDVDGFSRILTTAHGHTLRVAGPAETRCGWRIGDTDQIAGDRQCLGIDGHRASVHVGGITGTVVEDYHINKELEAWPV